MSDFFKGLGQQGQNEDAILSAVSGLLNLEKKYTEREQYCLKQTTLINDEFLALYDEPGSTESETQLSARWKAAWLLIKRLYDDLEGGQFTMILASVCNAILTQGRFMFVTSRRSVWELVKNDKNQRIQTWLAETQRCLVISLQHWLDLSQRGFERA